MQLDKLQRKVKKAAKVAGKVLTGAFILVAGYYTLKHLGKLPESASLQMLGEHLGKGAAGVGTTISGLFLLSAQGDGYKKELDISKKIAASKAEMSI